MKLHLGEFTIMFGTTPLRTILNEQEQVVGYAPVDRTGRAEQMVADANALIEARSLLAECLTLLASQPVQCLGAHLTEQLIQEFLARKPGVFTDERKEKARARLKEVNAEIERLSSQWDVADHKGDDFACRELSTEIEKLGKEQTLLKAQV